MPVDRRIIGEAAARLLDDIEARYGDRGELTAVMLIVAIDTGDDDTVEFRALDGTGTGLAAWKSKGLLAIVNENLGRPDSS